MCGSSLNPIKIIEKHFCQLIERKMVNEQGKITYPEKRQQGWLRNNTILV
jgi:hypothetical protein